MAENCTMNSQEERSSLAGILRDSALELLLTFLMLFGVISIVRWVIGPSPISRMIPEIHAKLFIVGVGVAILIAGLILSPPGRTTGGHMNPAITLAMWRFGVFRGVGVAPYIIAQLLGSVLGGLAARVVWGPVVAEAPVAYAVLGTSTGGSVNPARQFGPAALSGQTRFLRVYLLAPMAGAFLATWLRQSIQRHRYVLTDRLCGNIRDRSPLSG